MAADEQRDLRQRLSDLGDGISDEVLDEVYGGIWKLERITKADCPHCGKSANVRVPDHRGMTAALAMLLDQGKGKAATALPPAPKEASLDEMREAVRLEIESRGIGELARLKR